MMDLKSSNQELTRSSLSKRLNEANERKKIEESLPKKRSIWWPFAKALLVSVLGAASGLGIAFAKMGAAIFAAAVIAAIPYYAVGAAIGLVLYFAVPKICHFFAKKIIEWKIKKALSDPEPNKTQLKRWLTIANDGVFNEACWQYKFSDGRSLVRFALDAADAETKNYQQKLVQSESAYQVFCQQAKKDVTPEQIKALEKRFFKSQTAHKTAQEAHSRNAQTYITTVISLSQNRNSAEFRQGLKLKWFDKALISCKKMGDVHWQFTNATFYDDHEYGDGKDRIPALKTSTSAAAIEKGLDLVAEVKSPALTALITEPSAVASTSSSAQQVTIPTAALQSVSVTPTSEVSETKIEIKCENSEGNDAPSTSVASTSEVSETKVEIKCENSEGNDAPSTISSSSSNQKTASNSSWSESSETTEQKAASIPSLSSVPKASEQKNDDPVLLQTKAIVSATAEANRPTSVAYPEQITLVPRCQASEILSDFKKIQHLMAKNADDMMTPTHNHEEKYQASVSDAKLLGDAAAFVLPPHLISCLRQARLQQQMDVQQALVQQQQVDVKFDMTLNVETDLRMQEDNLAIVDNSVQNAHALVVKRFRDMEFRHTATWCEALFKAVAGHAAKFNINLTEEHFTITQQAVDILTRGNNFVRVAGRRIDLKKLPLGFYLDTNNDGGRIVGYVLKYNKYYRQYQCKKMSSMERELRSDPAEETFTKADQPYQPADDLLETEFLTKLKKEGVILTTDQHVFVTNVLSQEFAKAYYPTQRHLFDRSLTELMFPALIKIAAAMNNPELFSKFFNSLMALHTRNFKITTSYYTWEKANVPRDRNLLHVFAVYYLAFLKDGNNYASRTQIDKIKWLASLHSNTLQWFLALSQSYQSAYHGNFAETARGLSALVSFFGSSENVPTNAQVVLGIKAGVAAGLIAGMPALATFLDCMAIVRQKGPLYETLQLQLLDEDNIELYALVKSRELLERGYGFIHRAMLVSDELSSIKKGSLNDPFFITSIEFDKINFNDIQVGGDSLSLSAKSSSRFSYSVALYLRFVAVNIQPEYFREALAKFNTINNRVRSLLNRILGDITPEIAREIESQATALKTYALSLPTKLAAPQSEEKIYDGFLSEEVKLAADRTSKNYKQEDITQLFALLTQKSAIVKEHSTKLIAQIKQIDDFGEEASSSLSPSELSERLQKVAVLLREENKGEARASEEKSKLFLECLALLRETHYRMTAKPNVPGQWIRLEQMVAILLACQFNIAANIATGEGKTLIIQMVALMSALQQGRTNVFTNNKLLAETGSASIRRLAAYLGLKVAQYTDSPTTIIKADIFYSDISSATLSHELAKFYPASADAKENKEHESKELKSSVDASLIDIHRRNPHALPGHRKAVNAIFDEMDASLIDIYGSTSMQISRTIGDDNDSAYEEFVIALNDAVRNDAAKDAKLIGTKYESSEQQKNAIATFVAHQFENKLSTNVYYTQFVRGNPKLLQKWISSAVTAMCLHKEQDYVIGEESISQPNGEVIKKRKVYIVRKKDTGEIDKESQWADGVHACVTAAEKVKNPRENAFMEIPKMADVIADGNIVRFANTFTHRVGFTGSLGASATRQQIEQSLNVQSIDFPRAKRPEAADGSWSWPSTAIIQDEKHTAQLVYNRGRRNVSHLCLNRDAHFATLLTTIKRIQSQDKSIILFWTSIDECKAFRKYLLNNQIDDKTILLFDGTNPEGEESIVSQDADTGFHPPKNLVIELAKKPKQITLTTAIGGRGIDYRHINYAILAKPASDRVTHQQASRIARDRDVGTVDKIYCVNDFDDIFKAHFNDLSPLRRDLTKEESDKITIKSPDILVQEYEQRMDASLVSDIRSREALRQQRANIQVKYLAFRQQQTSKGIKIADNLWPDFFKEIDSIQTLEVLNDKWKKFKEDVVADAKETVMNNGTINAAQRESKRELISNDRSSTSSSSSTTSGLKAAGVFNSLSSSSSSSTSSNTSTNDPSMGQNKNSNSESRATL